MFDTLTSSYHQRLERASLEDTVDKWRRRGVISDQLQQKLKEMMKGDMEMYQLAKTIVESKKKKK